MAIRIQVRRDTAEAWESIDPVLAVGEPGYDRTNRILKLGDGERSWSELPGISVDVGGSAVDVEFGATDSHLQWRSQGSGGEWNDLVELSVIQGPPGPTGPAGFGSRHYGEGPPGTIIGAHPGDEYLDTLTGDLYVLN